jgi:hypothetical protein
VLGAEEDDDVDLDAIEDAMLLAAAEQPPRNATEFIEQCFARLART